MLDEVEDGATRCDRDPIRKFGASGTAFPTLAANEVVYTSRLDIGGRPSLVLSEPAHGRRSALPDGVEHAAIRQRVCTFVARVSGVPLDPYGCGSSEGARY